MTERKVESGGDCTGFYSKVSSVPDRQLKGATPLRGLRILEKSKLCHAHAMHEARKLSGSGCSERDDEGGFD